MIKPLLALGLAGSALFTLLQPAAAQSSAPVSIVVPYPAGGGSDFIARTLAPVLAEALGRNLIVENLGGAGGAVGSHRVLQRPADGGTLLLGSPNEVILAPAVNKALDYKAEDFRLIGPATVTSQVLVGRSNLEVGSIKELLDQARKPGAQPVSYGSVGIGSLYHVTGAVLAAETGANMFHVPYRGAAPLVQDLIGGQVDISFLPLAGNVLGLIKEGKLKPLGVAQADRNPLAPDIPTLAELDPRLKDFRYPTWAGLLVKAGTPDAEVVRLQAALAKALADPKVRTAIEGSGSSVAEPMLLEQADNFYASETAQFRKIVADNQISVD
ncbi:tripartite tricarboxylate transporter substrate binding protein [Parapusillimonas sp. SGNA-6]|nr:tripartite tricarboxylate transporter substrate binding protein [Parapusillimonas sp. SGNA-6]